MANGPRTVIWAFLVASHGGIAAWGSSSDRVGPIVAGSIYLPLWPFDQLGLPVFHRSGWFFPPPTVPGWSVLIAVWVLVYWYLAAFVVWLFRRRRPA